MQFNLYKINKKPTHWLIQTTWNVFLFRLQDKDPKRLAKCVYVEIKLVSWIDEFHHTETSCNQDEALFYLVKITLRFGGVERVTERSRQREKLWRLRGRG